MGWRQGIADCLDFAVGDMLIVETLHIGMPGSLVNSLMAGERSEHRWVLRTVRESCGIRSRASVVEPNERNGAQRNGSERGLRNGVSGGGEDRKSPRAEV